MKRAVRAILAASAMLCVSPPETMAGEGPVRIAIIIAQKDYRDEELEVPKRLFEESGAEVTVASRALKEAVGMLGGRTMPDTTVDRIDVSAYAGIVFAGGAGAAEYWDDPVAHAIARRAVQEGKVLGAICFGPVTLANAGVLKDRAATVWPSESSRLIAGGADYRKVPVQVDGTIVTADGPSSARAFAAKFLEMLRMRAREGT